MTYADRSVYQSSGRPVFVTALLIVMLVVPMAFLVDGIVRSLANMPQLHQTHVRFTWLDNKGVRQCVVAIRGQNSLPCARFTKEQIGTFRLQYEKPAAKVLAGDF